MGDYVLWVATHFTQKERARTSRHPLSPLEGKGFFEIGWGEGIW
jgi:hypothetical protein